MIGKPKYSAHERMRIPRYALARNVRVSHYLGVSLWNTTEIKFSDGRRSPLPLR
jgi:hypothetical protein